jgi:hypothetical protein
MISVENAHVAKGLSRVIEQWRGKPVFETILNALLEECQELEDAFQAIIASRYLSGASGHALELLGGLVLETRKAHSLDATYLKFIRATIKAHKSQGTFDHVLGVVNELEDPDNYEGFEFYPLAIYVEFSEPLVNTPREVFDKIVRAKGGSVWIALAYPPDSDDAFSCCEGTTEASTTEGFGLTDLSTGGDFCGVYAV